MSKKDGAQEGSQSIVAAADAAARASLDAATVARSAADTTTAAHEAAAAVAAVASDAKRATAMSVAAAASAAAKAAAREASAVHAEAVTRALEVAAAAVAALETIAADLPEGTDPDEARRAAAAVAAKVAEDVTAQAKLTASAAARVAEAVRLAAEGVALAAATAAAIVDMAADDAEVSADLLVGSSAATEVASDVAVESSSRAADLAARRVDVLRQPPLVMELREAVERGELRLHYQPMYSMTTGAIVSVESLLRWQHPTRGLLPPSEFLEVAEGPSLVTVVGDWVLETAIVQAASWQRSFGEQAPAVWMNIACDQLGKQHLTGVVERLLTDTGVAPGALGVEVTERQLARRVDDVASDLMALHELGLAMSVDDFGTGYASLDYLRRFDFDDIKIDRSFVSGLNKDKTDTAVTASIISLGAALGLTVIAEGVETQDQYDRLQELGCAVSQGYLLHRPVPPETITDLLQDTTAPPATADTGSAPRRTRQVPHQRAQDTTRHPLSPPFLPEQRR